MSLFRRKTEQENLLERRERLRLTAVISGELRKQESLRKSILDELHYSGFFSRLFRHPATLVILTFLFTTVFGTYLSNSWQSAEKQREESLQSQRRALEEKYQITNETAKAIGQIYASTTTVLAAMQLEDNRARQRELLAVVPSWKKAKSEWLINHSILLGKITVSFPLKGGTAESVQSDDPRSDFENIFNGYKQVNQELVNMIERLGTKKGVRDPSMPAKTQELLTKLNSNIKGKLTKHLMEHMATEIGPSRY